MPMKNASDILGAVARLASDKLGPDHPSRLEARRVIAAEVAAGVAGFEARMDVHLARMQAAFDAGDRAQKEALLGEMLVWWDEMRAVLERLTPTAHQLAPEDECSAQLAIEGFHVVATGDVGPHTGRPRYRVTCHWCNTVVHEATTGPQYMAAGHLGNHPDCLALTRQLSWSKPS